MIIDADVHALATQAAIAQRLPQRWRDYESSYGVRSRTPDREIIRMRAYGARTDAHPPGGGPPGSDAAFMAEQLLDTYGITYAILSTIAAAPGPPVPPGYAVARARATNEWLRDEFLDVDGRWRASINLAYEQPGATLLKELERWLADERFVQVGVLSMRMDRPLGDIKYWDLLEALAGSGLPIALHPGGGAGGPVTGSGWPSYYFEDHVGFPQAIPSHLASLIFNGVFDRFPALQVVIVEGGWSWVAPLAWRLDASFRVMGGEVPGLQRRPSEYLNQHVWLTTQPMEEPEDPRWFAEVLAQSDMLDHLMYSSDYPHWDFDAAGEAFPPGRPADVLRKILSENAGRLYGLEAT